MSALEVRVPDIGDFNDIPVIEVLVKAGQAIARDEPLITLESDKATMEVPSPVAGTVATINVKLGDKVRKGSPILTLDAAEPDAGRAVAAPQSPPSDQPAPMPAAPVNHHAGPESHPIAPPERVDDERFRKAHASPSVRKFARQLGVDLALVKGSGPKERILTEDVQAFVKRALSGTVVDAGAASAPQPQALAGLELLAWPSVEVTKYGEIEIEPLSRIRKISGANLHRNWVTIPHVTQHDDADITALEAFRVRQNSGHEQSGVKVTMLAFLIAAAVAALRKYPEFNASLTKDGDSLALKKYFHIGFAADTPGGLVVPVIRDADRKGVLGIAREMSELAAKAREGRLAPADMQGGCFSISSLGGIGGTYFTPIINAPEVAILGVSRAQTKPVWNGSEFMPRLLLPLSLSYDHRVIDGAAAARFVSYLGAILADLRRVIM
jgi:pyruvate dehydrogenase E2 component (dihydrolipoamide acetyltransferase)